VLGAVVAPFLGNAQNKKNPSEINQKDFYLFLRSLFSKK